MQFGQIVRCRAPCQVALFDPNIGNGGLQRLSFSPIYALAQRVLADGVLGDGCNLVIRERVNGCVQFCVFRLVIVPSRTGDDDPADQYPDIFLVSELSTATPVGVEK
jgi:hypothetical protein